MPLTHFLAKTQHLQHLGLLYFFCVVLKFVFGRDGVKFSKNSKKEGDNDVEFRKDIWMDTLMFMMPDKTKTCEWENCLQIPDLSEFCLFLIFRFLPSSRKMPSVIHQGRPLQVIVGVAEVMKILAFPIWRREIRMVNILICSCCFIVIFFSSAEYYYYFHVTLAFLSCCVSEAVWSSVSCLTHVMWPGAALAHL